MATITSSGRRRRRNKRYPFRCLSFILKTLLLMVTVAWLLALFWLTTKSDSSIIGEEEKSSGESELTVVGDNQLRDEILDLENLVTLSLEANGPGESTVDIRLRLFADDAPKAAKYVRDLATNDKELCSKCTIYRGEPVPDYWGSDQYPDRYFDGGRWGPPYALVQGAFLSDNKSFEYPPPESFNPVIERGMVAWAGGKGGPHFFVALAKHPEWGHGHTVFGLVVEQDMAKVDSLLLKPLVSTKPKRPPIVSNFVTPIPFRIRMNNYS